MNSNLYLMNKYFSELSQKEMLVKTQAQHEVSYDLMDTTAIISISGSIVPTRNVYVDMFGGTPLDELRAQIAAAEENPDVEQIAFVVSSPGGNVVGLDATAKMLKAVRKPTVSFVPDLAASAAYWLASSTNAIIADRTAEVGSIGVIMSMVEQTDESIAAEGFQIHTFTNADSPLKDGDLNKSEVVQGIQDKINKLGDMFITAVANNRRVSKETVINDFGKGDTLLAEDALAVGMIDGVATEDEFFGSLLSMQGNKKETGVFLMSDNLDKKVTGEVSTTQVEANESVDINKLKESLKAEVLKEDRARVAKIRELTINGNEDLAEKAIIEGTSAHDFAISQTMALKAYRDAELKKMQEDKAEVVAESDEIKHDELAGLEGEALWSAEFDKGLAEGFRSKAAYIAYKKRV